MIFMLNIINRYKCEIKQKKNILMSNNPMEDKTTSQLSNNSIFISNIQNILRTWIICLKILNHFRSLLIARSTHLVLIFTAALYKTHPWKFVMDKRGQVSRWPVLYTCLMHTWIQQQTAISEQQTQ